MFGSKHKLRFATPYQRACADPCVSVNRDSHGEARNTFKYREKCLVIDRRAAHRKECTVFGLSEGRWHTFACCWQLWGGADRYTRLIVCGTLVP